MSIGPFQAMAWVGVVERVAGLLQAWRDRREIRRAARERRKEEKEFNDAISGNTD